MTALTQAELDKARQGAEISHNFVEELRKKYKREGILYEPSVIAQRPTIPEKTGKGVRASTSYFFRWSWYWIWSGLRWLFVEPQRL
ncbi:MAG TPA: hypothetical protein VIH52_02445 [Candidatus Nanoarchaeia archaeon]